MLECSNFVIFSTSLSYKNSIDNLTVIKYLTVINNLTVEVLCECLQLLINTIILSVRDKKVIQRCIISKCLNIKLFLMGIHIFSLFSKKNLCTLVTQYKY